MSESQTNKKPAPLEPWLQRIQLALATALSEKSGRASDALLQEAMRLGETDRLAIWKMPLLHSVEKAGGSLLMAAAEAGNELGVRWLLSWAPKGATAALRAGDENRENREAGAGREVSLIDQQIPFGEVSVCWGEDAMWDVNRETLPAKYRSALMRAAEKGKAGIVRELLRAGADPTASSEERETALMLAIRGGHAECALALAPVSSLLAVDREGASVAHRAAEGGHPQIIPLFANEAAQGKTNKYGWTPLMVAAAAGHLETVELWAPFSDLLRDAADGYSALRVCCNAGRGQAMRCAPFLARKIREKIAEKSDPAPQGWASEALAEALRWGSANENPQDLIAAADALAECGADPLSVDEAGESMLDAALRGEAARPAEAIQWILSRAHAADPARTRQIALRAIGKSVDRREEPEGALFIGERLKLSAQEWRQAVGDGKPWEPIAKKIAEQESSELLRGLGQSAEETRRAPGKRL